MPTKKTVEETVETNPVIDDGISVVVPKKAAPKGETRVRIFLPLPSESESGLKVDPYEHVTINGNPPVLIKRGEYVEVTVPVFEQLRKRYPNI